MDTFGTSHFVFIKRFSSLRQLKIHYIHNIIEKWPQIFIVSFIWSVRYQKFYCINTSLTTYTFMPEMYAYSAKVGVGMNKKGNLDSFEMVHSQITFYNCKSLDRKFNHKFMIAHGYINLRGESAR